MSLIVSAELFMERSSGEKGTGREKNEHPPPRVSWWSPKPKAASQPVSDVTPVPVQSEPDIVPPRRKKSGSHTGPLSATSRAPAATKPPFETSVVTSVKANGFLRVSEGDWVVVLDVAGGAHGMAQVKFGGQTGRVPTTSLLIDQHCSNTYLQGVVKLVTSSAALLQVAVCVEEEPLVDSVVDMLATRPGSLVQALTTLVGVEVKERRGRHAEMETLRADCAALRLVSAVLRRASVAEMQRSVREKVAAALKKEGGVQGDVAASGEAFLRVAVPEIVRALETAPAELVAVMRGLQGGGAEQWLLSFVCCAASCRR